MREKSEKTYEKAPEEKPFQSRRPTSNAYKNVFQEAKDDTDEDMHQVRWVKRFK